MSETTISDIEVLEILPPTGKLFHSLKPIGGIISYLLEYPYCEWQWN